MARKVTITTIRCAKCGKPVEAITSYRDARTMNQVFTVYCHGDKETTELEPWQMRELGTIVGGTAFKPKLEGLLING